MLLASTAADFWRWQPHPEVWLLVGFVVALGLYVARVIGPKVVAAGEAPVTRRQKLFFVAGVLVLWLASDWPMHDVGEEYLYAVHMVQHALLTMALPPLILFAIPEWLGRLVIGDGAGVRRWARILTRPVVAGVLFNVVIALTHWSAVVNASVGNGALHYAVHLVVVLTAFLMWMPVVGPLPELRMSLPGQMVYLFLMSVIPTVPAAWLAIADGVVYEAYDHSNRMFGWSVTTDQQLAGLIMKVIVGFYLWGIIGSMFVRWATQIESEDPGRIDREVLTWEEVRRQLDEAPPAPAEP